MSELAKDTIFEMSDRWHRNQIIDTMEDVFQNMFEDFGTTPPVMVPPGITQIIPEWLLEDFDKSMSDRDAAGYVADLIQKYVP